ncbi:MAG TPA: PKD domain-containing protein [Candidatus Nanopelagicales bacterium]|nr:PKD domain-containing protein [Candidatus Nanopelagicales bacterium]
MRLPSLRTRSTALAAVVGLTALGVVAAAPAQAATPSTTLNFSGDATLQGKSFAVGCDSCIPGDDGLGVRLTAAVSAHWEPTASVTYQYSPSLIRQGQTLDLTDKLTPGTGPLTLTWSLSGDVGVYNFTGGDPADQFPSDTSKTSDTADYGASVTETSNCPLKLSGDGGYSCQVTHTFDVFNADLGVGGVDISVPMTTTVSLSPDGVTTVRNISVGGSVLKTDTLTFDGPSPSTISDSFAVPCNAVPGNELVYDLTSSTTDPDYSATTSANLKIDITVLFVTATVFNQQIVSVGPGTGTFHLTAGSAPVDFGPVLANNIPPTIVSPTSYTGVEGTPVQLDATGTTSVCPGSLIYVWNLSDGGIAYGISPVHTFTDNATWSGLLTVTDPNGNAAQQTFSVTTSNAAPAADAGPGTTAAWGRPVAFAGSAVDPGSSDQSTLSYTWNFDDGTPPQTTGASGATTFHSYSSPGTYHPTLVVTDKDGATSNVATRTIVVTKRSVTLAYLGTTSGVFDTPATLSASLVDQFGNAINSGPIRFTIGAEDEGTVGTSSSGIASQVATLGLGAGSYTLSAAYPGSSLYDAAGATSPFGVGLKATSIVYTGSLTGGPNKTITFSATLKDASGKALSGKTVTFVLGSQTATATTNASGIAATGIKLVQKNGTYTLTATYAGDASQYGGSATSATFKLQAK